MTSTDIHLVCLCNNEAILKANLLRSPDIASGRLPLHLEWNPQSAPKGLNRGLDTTVAGLVIFVHQDVYLPAGWTDLLLARLAEIEALDANWALVGAFGVDMGALGWGPVWSTSLGSIVGQVCTVPVPAQSFDELLIVLRRASGVRFDEALPGFHLYGTDIVQSAQKAGFGAWVASLPLIHNDGFHQELDASFDAAFHYLRHKWRDRLPLKSPVSKITWHGLNLLRQHWHNRKTALLRKEFSRPRDVDPRHYAALCGWSDLSACAARQMEPPVLGSPSAAGPLA
jgi:hypothetical protein